MSLRGNRSKLRQFFEISTHPSGSRNDRLIKQLQEKSLNLGIHQASVDKNRILLSSRTAQLKIPVAYAPVSNPIRLESF
jgi:hypothetical protein